MSGHSGFVSLSGAIRPNIVAGMNPVGEMPPAEGSQAEKAKSEIHDKAQESFKAASLVRDLDIMLAKAASSARGAVDADAVHKAASKAKIPDSVAAKIKDAVKSANATLLKLDAFTGAQLANAMVRAEDGVIDWNENNPAGKAVKDAMDAQADLSEKISDAINSMTGKVADKVYDVLEEAMLQADRRISEIRTIVLHLTEIADKGLANNIDDFTTEESLNRSMGDIAAEKALSMHDNATALDALKARLDPIAARLDSYAVDVNKSVSSSEMKSLMREISAADKAIRLASRNGFVEIDAGKDKPKRKVFVDRAFLDEAAKLVESASKRLGDLTESVAKESVKKFIDNEMPWFEDPIFDARFADDIKALSPGKLKSLARLAHDLGALRTAMCKTVKSPHPGNFAQVRKIARSWNTVLADSANQALASGELTRNKPPENASEEFKKAHAEFLAKTQADPKYVTKLADYIRRHMGGLRAAAEHFVTMLDNTINMNTDALRTSGAIREVFMGERNFSSLVESRVRGYADGDVNPGLDDMYVESSEFLGSGTFNSVSLVKYKDGSQYVFKPEIAGRLTAAGSSLQYGMKDVHQMTNMNIAVHKTAEALGLDDVMVKTTAGTHKGEFGMFMEKAPGVTAADFYAGKKAPDDEKAPGEARSLGRSELAELDDAKGAIVYGRLMRACNRLQWFDVITGQCDRHSNNYMMDVREDLSVSVKGIDNDDSYGTIRESLFTFRTKNPNAKKRLVGMLDSYARCFPEAKDGVRDELMANGLKIGEGEIMLDLSKAKSPLAAMFFAKAIGAMAIAVPKEMDKDLYDRLMKLKNGPDRKKHLAELKNRLGDDSPEYSAAVKRLDETIKYAAKLAKDGLVYSEKDWENANTQKTIAANHPRTRDFSHLGGKAVLTDEDTIARLSASMSKMLPDNLVFRDLIRKNPLPKWIVG